ncbi:helix-turn-helix domain-containing protein [Corynebacterium marambiense]|uniref:helix-turn-helix domain-containing protein n=1 Tax=Corynebacterium TaxID=1716 RepID=UPI003523194F
MANGFGSCGTSARTSKRSVQNWVKAGVLPGAMKLPNGQWRIPLEAILRGEGGPAND